MGECIICLKELPLFFGLSQKEFDHVCLCANKQIFLKGSNIVRQGDLNSTIYLVKIGKLKLVQLSTEGREIILDIVGPGEILGDTSLFKEKALTFSAVAMEDVKICSFSKEQFEKLVITNPRIAIKIINYLSDKLNDSYQQAGDSRGTSIRDKLLKLFIRLADDHGKETPSEKIIELIITQQDIADMIGASRVMVVQTLKELQTKGVIGKCGKYYTLRMDFCMNDIII